MFGISFENSGFAFIGLLGVCLFRKNGYGTLVPLSAVEVNDSVCQGIEGIILSLSYVVTREMLVATLAYNNIAGNNSLTAPDFYA